jgi:S-DNA-T family DNA segregation ATPase FtsK/SpoIIIE
VEFQISVVDVRNSTADRNTSPPGTDWTVTAEPQHRVAELALALAESLAGTFAPAAGGAAGPADLWLDGDRLDPGVPLASSGLRDGARLGFGGPAPAPRYPVPAGAAQIRVVAGPDAGLVIPVGPGEHEVGRGGRDVGLTDPKVSRGRHCVISVSASSGTIACTVRNGESRYGTGLDGKPVGSEPVPLRPGQIVAAGLSLLTLAEPEAGHTGLRPDPGDPFTLRVNQPPRPRLAPPGPVTLDIAAEPAQRDRMPSWLTQLAAPAISIAAGVVFAVVTGQWYFLLLGLAGVVATLFTQLSSRRANRSRSRRAQRDFEEGSAAAQARLAELVDAEQRRRRDAAPDPAHLLCIATAPGTRLWERAPDDDDFLRLRVGWADLPAETVGVRGASAPSEPVLVHQIPATVSLLDAGALGLAVPARRGRALLDWLVCQLAVLHSPERLRLVLLTEDSAGWDWIRWLPHLQPLPGSRAPAAVGTDLVTCEARVKELRGLVDRRRRQADPRGRAGAAAAGPAVVVVLDGSHRLCEIPGLSAVLADGPAVGVYAICRDDAYALLPRDCRSFVTPEAAALSRFALNDRGRQVPLALLDEVGGDWADQVARALAPLRDGTGAAAAGLPASARLLDLYGAGQATPEQVAGQWRRRGRATAVPLGRTETGTFGLDIAKNGPHMLVAGTTGAGKSEFLRTLVCSLALGNRPDALVFVLIDFKGGAAFRGLRGLPHVVGYLTDLDEHLGHRALEALAAEVRYRERLLGDANCRDIDAYHAAGEPLGPLPRLAVVIDEFRFLVREMPDFLDRLTDVTARGRSLGIHLVLATQRPAGVVSEDIRTNMGLRVCFRVEDAADSTAVLDIPDAAGIGRAYRGRGFARAEQGAGDVFQAAYVSGLPPDVPDTRIPLRVEESSLTDLAAAPPDDDRPDDTADDGMPDERTDLAALVRAVAGTNEAAPGHRPWLDPLPPQVCVADLPGLAGLAEHPRFPVVAYGLADLPAEQSRRPAALDLGEGGNLLAVGAAQSGRTTLLRTIAAGIARDHSPADVHLYVLDCDAGGLAPLSRLPHCGAVVRRAERERAARLLDRLTAEVNRRQDLLAESGFGSVTEQRAHVRPADRLPYLVLLLDLWDAFLAHLGQVDNGRLPELAYRLFTEGASAGLRVVVTGDKTAVGRLGSYFPDRLVLRMANADDLLLAGVPKGAMPVGPPPGRGVAVPSGTETQIAFIGADPAGNAQNAALEALIGDASSRHPRPVPAPLRVDPLPTRLSYASAGALPAARAPATPLRAMTAVGGDDLDALVMDLGRFPGFAIAGPRLSGRSTALLVMAESLLAGGTNVIVFAPIESPLQKLDGRTGVLAVCAGRPPAQEKLVGLLDSAGGPVAVLVDDAEVLHGTPIADVLSQIPAKGRSNGHALVIAGATGELVRFRDFTAAARQFRCGLLLTPEQALLGQELFGARLPRSAVFDGPAGRGYLIQAGRATLAQVPEPPTG